MVGIAAGLATTGKIPFVSSFAMFAAGRAFEQVRNSVGYPKLNVKIGATHAGISVGEDGATHQCCEDLALMRTIPGMVVMNPSDDVEAKAAVKAALDHEGPVYIRFGRLAVPVINDNPDYKFELGKGVVLREGKDVTLIATGLEVSETLVAAEKLAQDGIDAQVINIHTIKPLDEDLVVSAAKKTGTSFASCNVLPSAPTSSNNDLGNMNVLYRYAFKYICRIYPGYNRSAAILVWKLKAKLSCK